MPPRRRAASGAAAALSCRFTLCAAMPPRVAAAPSFDAA